jgi:hypothetical protein
MSIVGTLHKNRKRQGWDQTSNQSPAEEPEEMEAVIEQLLGHKKRQKLKGSM